MFFYLLFRDLYGKIQDVELLLERKWGLFPLFLLKKAVMIIFRTEEYGQEKRFCGRL